MRIVAACLLPAALLGCASIQTRMTETTPKAAVTVDSRIELMGVIQLLSDYFLVSYLDSSYKLEAAEYFASCRDHPAVSKFSELSSSDFSFSTVPDAFIALSEPPMLEQRYPPKPEVTQSAGGPKAYAEFLSLTRAFASDCGFPEFYARNRPYYDRLIAQSRPSVTASTRILSAYLGMPLGSTEVVLGPLLHDGGFATRYDSDDGKASAYAFIGPASIVDGETNFGTSERLQPLISHEFAHTVINPLTARYSSEVGASAANFDGLVEAMRREGYTTWDQVINESIIRAVTARLTTQERGNAAGEAEIADELQRGFVYVPALISALEHYEAHRETYPTIESYYPNLLRVFEEATSLS